MDSMYYPSATLFSSSSTHIETARLALARRIRQFAEEKSSRSAAIGTIDVHIMDDAAIASYPYEFRLTSLAKDGSLVDVNVPFAGATQVFLRDKSGVLRIVHEHLSAAEPGKKTPVPRLGAAIPESLMPRQSRSGAGSAAGGASLPPTDRIFAEQVRSEIRKLWQLFRNKDREGIERAYSPTAIAWTIGGKRGVAARLALAAKAREVLGPQSSIRADVGSIDVQALNKNAAVAYYSFHYRIVMVQRFGKRVDIDMPFQGKRYLVDCPSTRQTQVFERDDAGAMHIVHEHMSTAGIPIYTELSATDSEAATAIQG
jgi:ketosteroid isomerase-like protein